MPPFEQPIRRFQRHTALDDIEGIYILRDDATLTTVRTDDWKTLTISGRHP